MAAGEHMIKIMKYHHSRGLYFPREKRFIAIKELKQWDSKNIPFRIMEHGSRKDITHTVMGTSRELIGRAFNPDPLTHRLCRVCKKRLPASRYFNHRECLGPLIIPYGTLEYGKVAIRSNKWGV